jgi:ATP-dependent exoDNAse (exonuclease V) beta subunit
VVPAAQRRDLPGGVVSEPAWNEGQRQAIERRGHVFVSAGAGTGKTAVLVERVVRRVQAGTPLDHLLVITFTERAAAELKGRVRTRLREVGHEDAATSVDSAWISTIHGFCGRVLRAHALDAGIDPTFRVSSETEALILQGDAFARALERFVAAEDDARLDLLAVYRSPRLRRLVGELHERLRGIGSPLELQPFRSPDLRVALAQLERAATELGGDRGAAVTAALAEAGGDPARLLDLRAVRPAKSGVNTDLAEAIDRVQQAALDVHADADRVLIEELLRLFGEEYAALKDARGLLDFNDLELRARDLLRARPDVAGEYRERFVEVMVDEFQDTNRLQVELVELVRGDELFLVGDEFQSIYRFRRAEVEIFRRLRAEAGDEVVVLPENYRSRPHVIDLVNEVYGREFGIGYQELVSSGRFADGPPGPGVVELLLADRDAFEGGAAGWREGEADALSGRIAELVDEGGIRPGQIVLLLEAGTDAGLYEDALRRRGLPTVRATGRGYYGQQEVGDLLTYLRLLRTRTDDAALLGVLASPLVGVSNDGLALIRLATRRRAAVGVFEGGELPEALSAEDARLARAFWMRYSRLVAAMAGLTLEQLLERIVSDHDYDLALLAQPDGDRRQANVRKLIRLAREFEGVRGPDVEGFVQFCEEQADLAAREGEAAIADEGGEAVLLMTVHSAKGLEFDVVVVADTGRVAGGTRTPDVLVAADGRVAFKAVHPLDGRLSPALGHAELGEAEDAAAAEEGRRLQYVAMTRARHHLIISGALGGNGGAAEAPIARLCHTLEVDLEDEGRVAVGRTSLDVRVVRPRADEPPQPGEGQLPLFQDPLEPPADLPELEVPPAPPANAVRRLSYSGLQQHARCGYRFYAQRLLGLPERVEPRGEDTGMVGVEIGDAVHLLLEREDERWRLRYPAATAEDAAVVARMLESWRGSELAGRVSALDGDVRRELTFAFELDGVLFRGRFDLFHRGGDGAALVVDYKTNLLGEREPAELVEASYGRQVAIYALAVLRAGAPSVEIVYAFLDRPGAVWSRTFDAAEAAGLEEELRGWVTPVADDQFAPNPGPWCADCPALDVLCAGPELVLE